MLRTFSISILILLLACCNLSAQGNKEKKKSSISIAGTVFDKKGNPIPGVKVQALTADVFSITDLEGNFQMDVPDGTRKVQALYAGMVDKTQRISPEMTIVMKNENMWNKPPHQAKWFIVPQVIFPERGIKNPAFGVMAGRMKKFGVYAKFFFRPGVKTTHTMYGYEYWTTGVEKHGYWGIIGGGVARVWGGLHLYLGVGYQDFQVAWQLTDGSYARNLSYSSSGLAPEGGILLKLGMINITGGTIFMGDSFAGSFGIGINF